MERPPVRIGMSKAQVLEKWGPADKINRTRTGTKLIEQWVYYYCDWWLGVQPGLDNQYLYFYNGKLETIQD